MSECSLIADRKVNTWPIKKLFARLIPSSDRLVPTLVMASLLGLSLNVSSNCLSSSLIREAYAEESQNIRDISSSDAKEEKDKFPQQGTLASVGSSGRMSKTGGFGKTVIGEEVAAPFAASVSRGRPGWWSVTVSNHAEKRITADLCFVQANDKGNDIRRDCFSEGLAGGESNKREFRAAPKVMSARVDVSKWVEKGAKEKSKEGASTLFPESPSQP